MTGLAQLLFNGFLVSVLQFNFEVFPNMNLTNPLISHMFQSILDRYPLGIEATLGNPSPNVVFVNDTWTPVIIRTSYTSTSITVEFWGNNGGRTVVGSHRNSKTTINVTSGGDSTARKVTAQVTGSATFNSGGFVTIKRTISGPDGSVTETWNHTYIGSSR